MINNEKEYRLNPALGSTDIKNLLDSPFRFKEAREHKEYKECYAFGTAFHLRCLESLEVYRQNVVFAEVKTETLNSKEGREFIAAHPEKIVVHHKNRNVIEGMHNALLNNSTLDALGTLGEVIPENSIIEMPFYAEIHGVQCKAKPDILTPDGFIIDIKTIAAKKLDSKLAKYTCIKNGYYLQMYHYHQVLLQHNIDVQGYKIIMVCKEEPHNIAIQIIDPDSNNIKIHAHLEHMEALEIYKLANDTGHWGGRCLVNDDFAENDIINEMASDDDFFDFG